LKVLVVDNYEKADWRLSEITDSVQQILETEPYVISFKNLEYHHTVDEFDAVLLSGSDKSLTQASILERYSKLILYVKSSDRPLLGICFGHQLIASAFDSRIARLAKTFKGFSYIDLLVDDPIFSELPKRIRVFESHSNVVVRLMPGFIHLARSEDCEIEAFRHNTKPVYGVQFHPERYDKENLHGRRIISNFLRLASR